MSRGIRYSVRGIEELEVGPSIGARYPEYLELGTRKMKRRPYIELISNQFAQQLAILLLQFSRTALSKGRGTRL
jgi:hypothetical protein